jgi:hypothetical protein
MIGIVNTATIGRVTTAGVAGYSYSTQYQAVINYANANSIPLPPEAIRIEDDTRVRESVTSGEWAGWDIFYYMKDSVVYR